MLDLNAKVEINGVTLYRDFDDKNVFYHAPGLPHIAVENGEPKFSLMVFQEGGTAGQETSGGFLTLVVSTDLRGQKEKVETELKNRFGGDVRLVSIDFTDATVRMIGLDIGTGDTEGGAPPTDNGPAGTRFVERVESTMTPMLSGDNRAFFSTRLSEDGAAFILGILEGSPNAMPFGVVYDFTFSGLLTTQDLKIEIDFERSYDFMRQRIGLNAVVVQAEIDNIVEQLKTNGSVKIIDTVRTLELSTPEAMQARQEAINTLVKELASDVFFRPTLTPGRPSTSEAQVFGNTANLVGGDPTVRAVASGGPTAGIIAGMSSAFSREMTGFQPEPPETDVPTTPTTAAPANGATSTATTAATPAATTVGANNAARASQVSQAMGTPSAVFVMRQLSQSEKKKVTYDLSRTAVQQRKYPLVNSLSFMASTAVLKRKVARIDLNHSFFKRIDIDIDASAMDFAAEGVTRLTVDFRYGKKADGTPKDEVSVILATAEDKRSFTFFADDSGTRTYQYRITAHYKADFGVGAENLTVEGTWLTSDARLISAHAQTVARRMNMNLRLPRVVPADLLEVRAIVRYRNADGTAGDSEEFILTPDTRTKNVLVRYNGPADTIELAAKAVFDDGKQIDIPVEKRPDPDNAAPDDAVEVFIKRRASLDFDIIMQDPLDELKSVIVDYEVTQDDQVLASKSVTIEQALVRLAISEPLPQEDEKVSLRVRESRLYVNGGLEKEPWKSVPDLTIIVGIPAADVRTVAIRYVGPPMDAMGLNGILVELEYKDPKGDEDYTQSESVFLNNAEVTNWRFRMADRKATTFNYRVTLFLNSGEEPRGDFKPYAGNDLILRSAL